MVDPNVLRAATGLTGRPDPKETRAAISCSKGEESGRKPPSRKRVGAVFRSSLWQTDRRSSARQLLSQGPILLYDGECGVCNRSVQWILNHERQRSLRFAPLQSPIGRQLSALAEVPEGIDSLLWVEHTENGVVGRFWSNAVFATLRYVGGPWRLFSVFRLVPTPLADLAYRLFARHRLKVAPAACLIPPHTTRARFLDA